MPTCSTTCGRVSRRLWVERVSMVSIIHLFTIYFFCLYYIIAICTNLFILLLSRSMNGVAPTQYDTRMSWWFQSLHVTLGLLKVIRTRAQAAPLALGPTHLASGLCLVWYGTGGEPGPGVFWCAGLRAMPTCCRNSILPTPLLLPFQMPVSFPPLKVLGPKLLVAGDWLAFQHSTTSWRLCIQHWRIGQPPSLEHGTFDSTLLISLYSNLATLYFVIMGWLPTTYDSGFPVQVLFSLIVISPSYLSCLHWVLPELLHLRTILVYPRPSLQMFPWIHTASTPTTPCNMPSTYWTCPTIRSVESHIISFNPDVHCIHPFARTQILINSLYFFNYETLLHTSLDH